MLLKEIKWQQDQLTLYGKSVNIPRLQAWYGEPQYTYTYSGLALSPQPLTPCLSALKAKVEHFTGITFNSLLANLYRDGNDSVSWHSDDEPELGDCPVIASLSFGETRNFQLKHKIKGDKLNIDLTAGSLLLMSGTTQHFWSHCVPKTKRVKSPRINLTFRQIIKK